MGFFFSFLFLSLMSGAGGVEGGAAMARPAVATEQVILSHYF